MMTEQYVLMQQMNNAEQDEKQKTEGETWLEVTNV